MSKSSCIVHPAGDRFVTVRASYLRLCGGRKHSCAAALLAVLEFWTNVRINSAEERGGDLWVYRTQDQLREIDLLGTYGRNSIMDGIDRLMELGYLDRRRNPRHGYDKTYQYLLNVEKVQADLAKLSNEPEVTTEFTDSDSAFLDSFDIEVPA